MMNAQLLQLSFECLAEILDWPLLVATNTNALKYLVGFRQGISFGHALHVVLDHPKHGTALGPPG